MIIGFEGHSYTGKTTLVEAIASTRGVTVIPEADVYAGGIDNYPPFPHESVDMAIENVNYFVKLEESRRQDADAATGTVVVDRTFISVALFQKFIRELNRPGWESALDYAREVYHDRINQAKVILPDAMVVVLCANEQEYASRLSREISIDELRSVEAYRFFTKEYSRLLRGYDDLGRLAVIVSANGDNPKETGDHVLERLDFPCLDVSKKVQLAYDILGGM